MELERRLHTASDVQTSPPHHQAGDNSLHVAPQTSRIFDNLATPKDIDGIQSHPLSDVEDDTDLMIDYGSWRERLHKSFECEAERLLLHEDEDLRQCDRAGWALLRLTYA